MRTMVLAAFALTAALAGAEPASGVPAPVPLAGARADSPAAQPYGGAYPQQSTTDRQEQRGLSVRVWTEDERDAFSPGDRTRVFVRTNAAAYVAVLHIDPSGNLEVLYPASPRDQGYLRQGRLYALPESGYWTLRGAPGLGYVFAVASDRPLDLGAIRDLYADRGGDGEHVVFGDPFETIDRVGRRLARFGGEGGYATDSYSYQLGGRFTYPRYACFDSYGSWYYGRTSQYGSCDRVRTALREDPSYYDTRGRRADRRVYADQRDAHTYKEDPRVRDYGDPGRMPAVRPAGGAAQQPARRDDGGDRDATRQRPTLQRRPEGEHHEPVRAEPTRPEHARPEPRSEPRSEPPPRVEPRRPDPPSRGFDQDFGRASSGGAGGSSAFGSFGGGRASAGSAMGGGGGRPDIP